MLTYYNNYVPLVQLKTINMPRQARKTSGTGIYHVMLRGINRQDIFEDDEDYMQFQRSLHQLVECYDEPAHSISDTGIKELLRLQYSNDNAMDVQNFEKNQRNKIIKELCNQGAGFRQLARITGFSYGIIQRVVTDQRSPDL